MHRALCHGKVKFAKLVLGQHQANAQLFAAYCLQKKHLESLRLAIGLQSNVDLTPLVRTAARNVSVNKSWLQSLNLLLDMGRPGALKL
jgi:hypothetical protein